MSTITQKEYRHLVQRQTEVEQELRTVKVILRDALDETQIRPSVLKKWERISRDLDRGKGRTFSSVTQMGRWLERM